LFNVCSSSNNFPSPGCISPDDICLIHSFIHSLMKLQPFVGPWSLRQFRNLICTYGRPPWTSEQPVAHRTTQTQKKRIHRYPCLGWVWNPRSQLSRKRRRFVP
jgi:hypothetical protein